jgi:hypothetical protein
MNFATIPQPSPRDACRKSFQAPSQVAIPIVATGKSTRPASYNPRICYNLVRKPHIHRPYAPVCVFAML